MRHGRHTTARHDTAWFTTAPGDRPWQRKTYGVIFGARTPAGKAFDVALLVTILASVMIVMLDSVESIPDRWHRRLYFAEWVITILFTIEYVLRLACVAKPRRYALSFFGVVDLLAILPTFATLILPTAAPLVVVRALRLLRVFRVLKLTHLMGDSQELWGAVWQARGKVLVFVTTVLIVVCIMGAAVYVVEEPYADESGFHSLPTAMYWAIVTMTTVGFGDVAPVTPVGRLLTAFIVLFGYSLIIVPTGFVTVEAIDARRRLDETHCPHCGRRVENDDEPPMDAEDQA